MDKQLIAERFARARATYSREARVQQQVAERMSARLTATVPRLHADRVVEFGCGTGLYSRLLWDTYRPSLLHPNDLCPEMALCLDDLTCHAGVTFEAGDAESCPMPDGLDLLTSCSTLQWFVRPDAFFHRARRLLKPDGILAVSTFGGDNLQEIRSLIGQGLPYPSPRHLARWLEEAGFRLLLVDEEREFLHFSSPTDVLRHLRMTGVTGTTKHVWSRERFVSFTNRYIERFSTSQGVILTYQPLYLIAISK